MSKALYCIQVMVVLLLLGIAAAPAGADEIQVTLPDARSLPSSPGYFVLNAKVTVGQNQFPMTFGLFLPAGYFKTKDPFPVVMTLHNKGLDGLGGAALACEGMASFWVRDEWDSRYNDTQIDPPMSTTQPAAGALNLRKTARFIGVAPQCPRGYLFSDPPMPQILSELLTQLGKAYRTDEQRLYLTGFSYGGTCTWQIAEQLPDRFAAIVPLSCRMTANPQQTAQTLKDLPIYLACGTNEWSIPYCRAMNDVFVASHHRQFVFRIINGGTHWCYPLIYADPAFWDWLLAQRRNPAAPATNPR